MTNGGSNFSVSMFIKSLNGITIGLIEATN